MFDWKERQKKSSASSLQIMFFICFPIKRFKEYPRLLLRFKKLLFLFFCCLPRARKPHVCVERKIWCLMEKFFFINEDLRVLCLRMVMLAENLPYVSLKFIIQGNICAAFRIMSYEQRWKLMTKFTLRKKRTGKKNSGDN